MLPDFLCVQWVVRKEVALAGGQGKSAVREFPPQFLLCWITLSWKPSLFQASSPYSCPLRAAVLIPEGDKDSLPARNIVLPLVTSFSSPIHTQCEGAICYLQCPWLIQYNLPLKSQYYTHTHTNNLVSSLLILDFIYNIYFLEHKMRLRFL